MPCRLARPARKRVTLLDQGVNEPIAVCAVKFQLELGFMHISFPPRLTWIARLALGLALLAQFALAAGACLLPQRSLASAPVVASLVAQDQQLPCSGAGCVAQLPDADICRAKVTPGDQAPGPAAISVTPDTASFSFFLFAPRPAVTPLAPSRDLVAGSSGSHLSILFCSFQI